MAPIDKIKLFTGSADTNLINAYIEQTQAELVEIAKLEEYSIDLDSILTEMVCVKMARRGNEGLVSFSGSGMSESYLDQYPEHIRRQLRKYTHKVVVK